MTSSPAPSAAAPLPSSSSAPQARLDARYGRTPRDGRRVRTVSIVAAVAFVAVFAAWVVWGGLSGTNASLEVRELGYRDATPTSVTVQWEVSVEPGTEVTCALQALNGSFGIVGWRIVELRRGGGADAAVHRVGENLGGARDRFAVPLLAPVASTESITEPADLRPVPFCQEAMTDEQRDPVALPGRVRPAHR